jgi:hypothetical protein
MVNELVLSVFTRFLNATIRAMMVILLSGSILILLIFGGLH